MKFKKQIARSTMNKLKKRTFTLLTALSMLFVSIPVYAESPTVETETPKEYIAPMGGCMSVENDLYCMFTIDVNEMQHYTEPTIPLDFAIKGIAETQQLTISVDGTTPLEHNQSEVQVYTAENNEVSLRITILEPAKRQDVENLEYEHITINLQNAAEENVYSIEASLINTQHGVFVSYVNKDILFMHYLQWLKNNKHISTVEHNKLEAKHHTINDTTSSFANYSTTSETTRSEAADTLANSTVRVDYTIRTFDSGETLYVDGYVYWGGTQNNKLPARYVSVDLCDEDVNYITIAQANTSVNGYFFFYIENNTGIFENGYDIRIRVNASSPCASIYYSAGAIEANSPTCVIVNCGDNITSNRLNKTYTSARDYKSESFYILDSFVIASNYVKAMSGDTMSSVNVTYPISNNISNYFLPSSGIHINTASQKYWDIVLHEYGHFVANHFNITPLLPVGHNPDQNSITYIAENNGSIETILAIGLKRDGSQLAWQEGWANYFSVSAQVHQNAGDLGLYEVGDASFAGYYIEGIGHVSSKGEGHELAVARALWDMADVNNDTTGATDNDPINWGFFKVWNYSVDSESKTFSDFMQYVYGKVSKTSTTYQNIGSILESQKICGYLTSLPGSNANASFSWQPAYSDAYVQNDYYLEIYNLNMTKIYTFNMGATGSTYTIGSDLWQSLCSLYGNGFYIAIRTVPEELGYATGPYYSSVKLYEP